MDENYPQQAENTFNWLEYGAIKLVYNEELLESATDIPYVEATLEQNARIVLAESYFDSSFTKHIVNASFALEQSGGNQSTTVGSITYAVSNTNPSREYSGPGSSLQGFCKYLDSLAAFIGFDMTVTAEGIVVENELYTFHFSLKNHPLNADEVTLTVEQQHDVRRPMPDDILTACQVWAHMCNYVVMLGTGKHESIPATAVTSIVVGELVEQPSDVEIALLGELDARRRQLGAIATLPDFSNSDILSLDIQRLTATHAVSNDEIVAIAKVIVDKKRAEYATFDVMTSISQSDILEAMAKVIQSRAASE